MTSMTRKILDLASFTVSGLAVRTRNSDEFNPATAKIGTMWAQFFSQQYPEKIPGQTPVARMLGVYSGYESDASGAFDVTAGMAVETTSPELATIEIQAGRYLAFECEGVMPAAVIQGWAQVWTYFQTNSQHQRRFATDFEDYLSPQKVLIYIGIE
ncbi:GyrI-like domain-containing protein [Undibacterium sp.]|uniref:GyrI-like domain-containing protein n=1 Tax=Undibacterium sp. TaxID=1914977 RepID=UPI0025E9A930|nr:GyrI-like domain-containing protein [Undibacterium sp.]